MFEIRPARQSDFPAIRALVRLVRINPMHLDWRRFLVAVTPEEVLIGCGQIKPHRDGSEELASIAVAPEWRKQGVAREIIKHLLEHHPGRLYLTCRASLGAFYARFGFRRVSEEAMPPYFRRVSRLFRVLSSLNWVDEGLLVMVREGQGGNRAKDQPGMRR